MKIGFVDKVARTRLDLLERKIDEVWLLARKADSHSTYFNRIGYVHETHVPLNEVVVALLKELGLDAIGVPAAPPCVRVYKTNHTGVDTVVELKTRKKGRK